jgi:hypothetical protein
MTTTLIVPAEPQSPVPSNQDSGFAAWKKDGEKRLRNLAAAKDAHERSQWEVGDWLFDGEKRFGEKAYEAAEELTGWTRGTLYNVVWVVGRFQDPSLRSETRLKWSHFKELARISDQNVREEVVGQLNDGFPHPVLDVRERVDAVLRKLADNKGPRRETQSKTWVYLQVSMKPDLRNVVKSYARAKRTHPDVLLRKIVTEYFEEHRREIEATIKRKNPRGAKKPVDAP